MIADLNLQVLAQFSAERLLNAIAAGAGIALFAWVLLRLIGKQNSGTRFAVWFAALVAIAVLPLSGWFGLSGSGSARHAEIVLPNSWATYLFAAWALIAATGLARVGIGLWQLRRLRKRSVPIPFADLDESLQTTLRDFDSSRVVTVCTSSALRMPTAVGFVRPLVVIPDWATQQLSPAQLNSILLHELAHLRRWDDCTNLAQKVFGALLFFHPAVWWIERKLTLEREMACDDLVLARVGNPRAYAECLVSLAEKSFLQRGLALAQAAVGRMRETSLRVKQILDGGRPRTTRTWMPALLLVSGFAFAFTLVESRLPRLVSFESPSPNLEAVAPAKSDGFDLSPAARVVPAKLTMPAEPVHPKPASLRSEIHTKKNVTIPARHLGAPMLLRTSMQVTPQVVPAVFVVMRTQEFDGPNSTRWTLCVWRVMVIAPAPRPIESGVIAKST